MLARVRARLGDDRGETLVEILVALSILSLAAVAVLAGVQLSTKTSDIHRKQTTGGAYVRTFAEAIQRYVEAGSGNYVPCAGENAYRVDGVMSQFTLPPGFTRNDFHQSAAVPLTGKGAAGGCADDNGLQKLVLTVSSSDGRAAETLVLVLRHPCDPSAPCPT